MGAVCGRPSRGEQRPVKRSPTKNKKEKSGGGATAAAATPAAVPAAAASAAAAPLAPVAPAAVPGAGGAVPGEAAEAPRPVTPSRIDEPTEEGRASAASSPRSHPLPPGAEGLVAGSSDEETETQEAAATQPSPRPARATVRPIEVSPVTVVPAVRCGDALRMGTTFHMRLRCETRNADSPLSSLAIRAAEEARR